MEAHPLPLFKVNEPREPIDFLHIIINSLTLHFVGYTILCLPIRWGMPKLTHLPHGLTNLLFHVLCKLWGPRWFAHVLTIALMLSSMVSDGPSKTHPPKSSIQRIPTNLWKSRYSYVNRNVCVCVWIYTCIYEVVWAPSSFELSQPSLHERMSENNYSCIRCEHDPFSRH